MSATLCHKTPLPKSRIVLTPRRPKPLIKSRKTCVPPGSTSLLCRYVRVNWFFALVFPQEPWPESGEWPGLVLAYGLRVPLMWKDWRMVRKPAYKSMGRQAFVGLTWISAGLAARLAEFRIPRKSVCCFCYSFGASPVWCGWVYAKFLKGR